MISTLEEAVERALAAESALERAERERDDYRARVEHFSANPLVEALDAAEARAQKAEEDRHGWYIELMEERGKRVKAQTKLEKAEAVVEAARQAYRGRRGETPWKFVRARPHRLRRTTHGR